MREILSLPAADVVPERREVLRIQNIPPGATLPDQIARMMDSARSRLTELAEPRGLMEQVAVTRFEAIYRGDGENDIETPLAAVYPGAERLALFAATMGQPLSAEIESLFRVGDFAAAVMLDAAASAAAECLVERLERRFATAPNGGPDRAVLAYSPGYCGWHVSGQRALFRALDPAEIGISLNESCLMQPLKSVSGVLVAGRAEIHDFDDDFPCCSLCSTRECRSRIERVRPRQ